MKVTVIDYGLSNLLSVRRALKACGTESELTGSRTVIAAAQALILPGVGAFEDGMKGLTALSLVETIRQKCSEGTPLLGICLGMQMLFDESEEFGLHPGLALIPGRVERIPDTDAQGTPQRVPHIGWEAVRPPADRTFAGTIFADVPPDGEMYFVHSYEAKPARAADRLAESDCGGRALCAAAQRGNVIGCQFHPEKSAETGLSVLRRFLTLCGT